MLQNLKLEIDVTPKTFEKIQALSRLTQVKPSDLTSQIGDLINHFLDEALIEATQEMLKGLGVDPSLVLPQSESISIHPAFAVSKGEDVFSGFSVPETAAKVASGDYAALTDDETAEEDSVGTLKNPQETKLSKTAQVVAVMANDDAEDDGPMLMVASSDEEPVEEEENPNDFEAGPSEAEFDEMDPKIDEDDDMKLFLGDDDMPIQNKNGDKSEFKDEFMNDIQDEFGDDDFDSTPAPAARVSKISSVPKDVDDESLDVLPQDFGIDGVSNDKGAMSFFNMAMTGREGDKSRRNGIKKKILMPGQY